MKNKLAVSIIVPVYNVEKYLCRCLDSILAQTFSNYECIIVDDASPDNCPIMCDEYAKKYRQFNVIHKKQNGGLPQARKTGLEIATGDFVLYVDSDDWIEPNMLEKMYDKAHGGGGYDIVCCNIDDETNYKYLKYNFNCIDKITILKQLLSYKFYVAVWNKLVKRSVYLKVFFPDENQGEDSVIIAQALYFAEFIGFIQAVGKS
jgi:glycosyltransferase involved in cell wall biosynthesis